MNAVERLQAAIEKLEALKAASTQPTDGNAWIQGRLTHRYEGVGDVYTGPNENTPGSADIVTYIQPEDAELIVTLHRTIDAQIRVLEEGKREWYRSSTYPTDVAHAAIALADAILGEF